MKRRKTSRLAIALAFICAPFLVGCGSSNGGDAGNGFGGYGNPYASPYGCIPLGQPIPFAGQGLPLDALNNIAGGQFPTTQSINGVVPTSGGASYGSIATNTSLGIGGATFINVPGSMLAQFSMNVQSGAPDQMIATTANINGTLQLGPDHQQSIYQHMIALGYNSGMNGVGYNTGTSGICVSGMAITGHLYTSTYPYQFGGHVALYLNNNPQTWYDIAL